jgi:hypothetical protein
MGLVGAVVAVDVDGAVADVVVGFSVVVVAFDVVVVTFAVVAGRLAAVVGTRAVDVGLVVLEVPPFPPLEQPEVAKARTTAAAISGLASGDHSRSPLVQVLTLADHDAFHSSARRRHGVAVRARR